MPASVIGAIDARLNRNRYHGTMSTNAPPQASPGSRIRSPLVDSRRSPAARLRTLSHVEVSLDRSGFWGRRVARNAAHTLRIEHENLVRAGNIHNLMLAAGLSEGDYRGPRYMDSDLYKWMEAAALANAAASDDALASHLDELISIIARAQTPEGYINSYYQISKPLERWHDIANGHELYCIGHLIQAAVAHHRTTGRDGFLNIAIRAADHVCEVFGPRGRQEPPGHPEIELALVELHRVTRDARYLDLAKFFIHQRGRGLIGGGEYLQDHTPVRDMASVAGHAVRQLYLMAGTVDVFLETGDSELLRVVERVWDDMIRTRLHIHGGAGSRHEGEAFGEPHELPNDRTYSETCAQIASIMWSWRMLLATGESKYADLIERTLYNGFLSGIDLAGERFSYPNPLLSRGGIERVPWFGCACCPPNVARLLATIGHYIATITERGVQIHLYDSCRIVTPHATLRVETRYPWDGLVSIRVEEGSGPFALALRLPEWCAHWTLEVNDHRTNDHDAQPNDAGYLSINRLWEPGDEVSLRLSIDARLTEAHPMVDACRGCVAIERGPIVYCVEQAGANTDIDILCATVEAQKVMLIPKERTDVLGGITVIECDALIADQASWSEALYRPYIRGGAATPPVRVTLEAIPYYAWANRGAVPMRVWLPAAG